MPYDDPEQEPRRRTRSRYFNPNLIGPTGQSPYQVYGEPAPDYQSRRNAEITQELAGQRPQQSSGQPQPLRYADGSIMPNQPQTIAQMQQRTDAMTQQGIADSAARAKDAAFRKAMGNPREPSTGGMFGTGTQRGGAVWSESTKGQLLGQQGDINPATGQWEGRGAEPGSLEHYRQAKVAEAAGTVPRRGRGTLFDGQTTYPDAQLHYSPEMAEKGERLAYQSDKRKLEQSLSSRFARLPSPISSIEQLEDFVKSDPNWSDTLGTAASTFAEGWIKEYAPEVYQDLVGKRKLDRANQQATMETGFQGKAYENGPNGEIVKTPMFQAHEKNIVKTQERQAKDAETMQVITASGGKLRPVYTATGLQAKERHGNDLFESLTPGMQSRVESDLVKLETATDDELAMPPFNIMATDKVGVREIADERARKIKEAYGLGEYGQAQQTQQVQPPPETQVMPGTGSITTAAGQTVTPQSAHLYLAQREGESLLKAAKTPAERQAIQAQLDKMNPKPATTPAPTAPVSATPTPRAITPAKPKAGNVPIEQLRDLPPEQLTSELKAQLPTDSFVDIQSRSKVFAPDIKKDEKGNDIIPPGVLQTAREHVGERIGVGKFIGASSLKEVGVSQEKFDKAVRKMADTIINESRHNFMQTEGVATLMQTRAAQAEKAKADYEKVAAETAEKSKKAAIGKELESIIAGQ